jgi:L-cysteate sulfo-lyase
MDTLSEKYETQLYIKRDDLTGVGAGGNKARKLEYLLADAREQAATSIVSGGALQSNHAAMTALCARKAGFECQLALAENVPIDSLHYRQGGNVVLDQLCGARITRYPGGLSSNERIEELAEALHKQTGQRPYLIPAGGSNAVGCLGYVRAALEITKQIHEDGLSLDTLALASGSAGTQAGLIVGFYLAGLSINVLGFSVNASQKKLHELVLSLCQQVGELLGITAVPWGERVWVDDRYVGPGYGVPYDEVWRSLTAAIEAEGLLFDPVYSGKGFTGLLDYLSKDKGPLGNTVFLHTGGLAGTLSYAELVQTYMDKQSVACSQPEESI